MNINMNKPLSAIQIHYRKTKPLDIHQMEKDHPSDEFTDTYGYNPFQINKLQLYNPIYSHFFELNPSNYNHISFNHNLSIVGNDLLMDHTQNCVIKKKTHIKFSPLLDPVRYLSGKYASHGDILHILPNLTNKDTCFPKISNLNNVSYVDAFYCFLTSKLMEIHNVFHGIDYYGSFLGIQTLYKFNATDDFEYLCETSYFQKRFNKEFKTTEKWLANEEGNDYANFGSRGNKNKLSIEDDNVSLSSVFSLGGEETTINTRSSTSRTHTDAHTETETDNILDIEDVSENKYTADSHSLDSKNEETESSDYSSDSEVCDSSDEEMEELEVQCKQRNRNGFEQEFKNDIKDENSEDNNSDNKGESKEEYFEDKGEDNEENEEYESESESESESEDEEEKEISIFIPHFPVQMICMEKCDGTLDELLENGEVSCDMASAYLLQIIMILIIYQRAFQFTHNDLHTNNIMYVNTKIKNIYYLYKNKYYCVPTYGKIFKIIDFGRAWFKYGGHTFYSDSFSYGGDAYSQYNDDPIYDDNKKRVPPNFSFDLCRLGCSLYDFIIDTEHINLNELDEFQTTVLRWCQDDRGKNVLYKRNGEERYPGFKLYKMIARTVHGHTPEKQLEYPFFSSHQIPTHKMKTVIQKIGTKAFQKICINIDNIPAYHLQR